jgi:hypothetical protein
MGKIPENLTSAVRFLAEKLQGQIYAIRGTASLVLQGMDFNVSDIDIVCDKTTALKCNDLFSEYLVKPVAYSESDKFKSFFGEFSVNGISIEIMGNWQIKDKQGNWSSIFDGSDRVKKDIDGQKVYLTTIEAELSMFMYMQRWNVYHKIKEELELQNSPQLGMF